MVLTVPLSKITQDYPFCKDFFLNLRILDVDWELPLEQALGKTNEEAITDFGLDKGMILRDFCQFLETFGNNSGKNVDIKSLTITGGHDKSGSGEIAQWTASVGEIISIVGPTGSGKSRLLADIECLADGDTPTGRKILVDGRRLTDNERFEMDGRLVAQLSQNMNFVMDLTVKDFLEMHAGSRFSKDVSGTIDRCFDCANELAGERFSRDTKLTQLSGGQSRALMIADTAYMSSSPIVLIDEIENAGIDRRRAISILARKEKIVFISTHDPLLALSADKRIVIKNGGVSKIIETSTEEKGCLDSIEKLDATLFRLRNSLRQGQEIKMETVKDQEN
ncbi:MAG: ATP-binding cassette domain-containing protein [Candidatus Riflebacteria bacterium]|nr:ATP-binding cassette domain-containing protein [Candidatus Riflebacteria bacterium]